MPRTTVRYEFGRLNLLPQVDDKLSYLMTGFAAGVLLEFRGSNWSFLDVDRFNVENTTYISGYLVKFKSTASREVADTSRRRIATEVLQNAIQEKSRFVLHVDSMIIAFHPVAPEISRPLFMDRFVEIFKAAHGGFFVDPQIILIQEHEVVLSVLPKFEAISRVTITLHPSNPRNTERWRTFDERFKELRATSYKEEYVAKIEDGRPGLRAAGDPEIEGKIIMAQDGYGEAKVTGLLDGKKRTVTTKAHPVTVTAPSDEVAEPQAVIETIHAPIRKFLERFK